MRNVSVAAPDLVRGIEAARSKVNEANAVAWYFFPVALSLKTPIPFLILSGVGFVQTIRLAAKGRWQALMPALAMIGIFLATFCVALRVATRHVLVVLPLIAILAGCGALWLWRMPALKLFWVRSCLCLLLVWQAAASIGAQSDFLAYFNELAPTDPSKALVKGCDLDCGQDLFRLADELRARHVSQLNVAIWSSADLAYFGLPQLVILQPHLPVTGWVAVSARSLRTGAVELCQNGHCLSHAAYPRDAFLWLEKYEPVAHVGKTIRLYYIAGIDLPTETRAGSLRNAQ